MPTYKITFTAATALVASAWTKIPLDDNSGPSGSMTCGDQAIKVTAVSSASGAAGELAFAWVNGDAGTATQDGITEYITATVTPTTRRQNYAGDANGYVCTVAFTGSTNKLDVLGIGPVIDLSNSSAVRSPRKLVVGCTSLGGLTSIEVFVTTTRVL